MLFLNRSFDKKRLKALLLWFRLNLSEGAALKAVEILQELGFRSATQGAISLGLDDLKTPVSKGGRVFQAQVEVALAHHEHHRGNRTPVELFQHLVDTWHRTSQDLTTEVVQLFHSTERVNPVYMMAFSGARGNISQVRQLVGMRGLMADPRGQIVGFPILSNFREGLTITEYFVSCYGARKGVVDTAIRTADAGYLTRRLADVSHHVVVRTTNCGTHRNIRLRDIKEGQKTILSLSNRLVGRVLAKHILLSCHALYFPSSYIGSPITQVSSHSQLSEPPLPYPEGVYQLSLPRKGIPASQALRALTPKGLLPIPSSYPYPEGLAKLVEASPTDFCHPTGESDRVKGDSERARRRSANSSGGIGSKPYGPKGVPSDKGERRGSVGQGSKPYLLLDPIGISKQNQKAYEVSVVDGINEKGKKSIFAWKGAAEERKTIIYCNSEITPSMASILASQHSEVPVRSPLSCSLPWGVCQLCYGWGLSEGRRVTLGEAVGIIAAQSIGEPGTQLTLRTFHTGGVFSGELLNEIRAPYAGNITFPKPLQGQLLRTPHGQIAFLTKVSGKMKISEVLTQRFSSPLLKHSPEIPFSVYPKGAFQAGSKVFRKRKGAANTSLYEVSKSRTSGTCEAGIPSHPRGERGKDSYLVSKLSNAKKSIDSVLDCNKLKENKDHEFLIQPSTVIFVKQKEHVYQNQLLAEFSSSTLQSANDQIEITQQVLAETAGQIWFKEIDSGNRKGPGSGSLGTRFSSQKLGGIWVLTGKPSCYLSDQPKKAFLSKEISLKQKHSSLSYYSSDYQLISDDTYSSACAYQVSKPRKQALTPIPRRGKGYRGKGLRSCWVKVKGVKKSIKLQSLGENQFFTRENYKIFLINLQNDSNGSKIKYNYLAGYSFA